MSLRKTRPSARPAARSYFSIGPACAVLALLVASYAQAAAQVGGVESSGTGGGHTIRGRIIFPSGKRADLRVKVRLESTGFGDLSVFSDMNGSFVFQSLQPGNYTVVIEGGEQYETVRESVSIDEANVRSRRGEVVSTPLPRPFTLQIYLRPKRQGAELARPGVLNAALASVPKPAVELYEKAQVSARRGEYAKAVEQLKAATQAHPDFALALSEMGVLHMKLKQPEKAAEALSAALKLSPDDFVTLLTYGRALYDLSKFSEAEEQFRKALKKNNASPSAHYYVALIMLKRRDLDGAEKELKSAIEFGGGEIPVAHYILGGVYWSKQMYKQAADELEAYLRLAPDSPDAARVRSTIKELRAKK